MADISIRVDSKLVNEAVHLFGAKSRAEAVRMALQEFAAMKRLKYDDKSTPRPNRGGGARSTRTS